MCLVSWVGQRGRRAIRKRHFLARTASLGRFLLTVSNARAPLPNRRGTVKCGTVDHSTSKKTKAARTMTELSMDTGQSQEEEKREVGVDGDDGGSPLNVSITETSPNTVQLELRKKDAEIRDILAKIRDMDAKTHDYDARKAGSFFTSLHDLCKEVQVDLPVSQHDDRECSYLQKLGRSQKQADEIVAYEETIEAIRSRDRPAPAYRYLSARGRVIKFVRKIIQSAKKLLVTSRSNAGKDDEDSSFSSVSSSNFSRRKEDVFGEVGGEVAHIVPQEPAYALFYAEVARCALGFGKDSSLLSKQCMVHGVLGHWDGGSNTRA